MKLQTKVNIEAPPKQITHDSSLLFIGSCFSENIGNIALKYKIPTILNPCGIAYNPSSVSKTIGLISKNSFLNDNDFIFHNDKWHSLHHHGRFSNADLKVLQNNIQREIDVAYSTLQTASHIFLTLGTAWVFEHLPTNQTVSNCHKIPSTEFRRHKLTVSEIVSLLEKAITQFRGLNKTALIIFTVSPIRHIKDGLHENQLSKASLLLAIDKIQNQNSNILYFPSYEIVMDEMRDYRFYSSDFSHLNELGINYIWEKFESTYIKNETSALFLLIDKIQKSLNHKAINKNTETYKLFKKKTLNQIENLKKKLPRIDFSNELKNF